LGTGSEEGKAKDFEVPVFSSPGQLAFLSRTGQQGKNI
jgi:hypothetical protein